MCRFSSGCDVLGVMYGDHVGWGVEPLFASPARSHINIYQRKGAEQPGTHLALRAACTRQHS